MKILPSLIITILLFTACSTNYKVEPEVTGDLLTQAQEKITTAKEEYSTAEDDSLKFEATLALGFNNMIVGEYGKSIDYYEEVLEQDPTNFPALNNIAVMYDKLGKLDKAIKYTEELYKNYSDNSQVVSDLVNLYLKDNHPDYATTTLDQYQQTDKGKANTDFVNAQRELIENHKQN